MTVSLCNNILNIVEEKRIRNKFSDITKKFGLNSLINSLGNNPENKINRDLSAQLERIRSSIVYTNQDDISSVKKIFEGNNNNEQNGQTGNNASTTLNSNSNRIKGFIQETNLIIENYEKEIEIMKHKFADQKLNSFKNNLEIDCKFENFVIPASEKIIFMNYSKYLTDRDPSLGEITSIFNEKIMELFSENEVLENSLKGFKNNDEEFTKIKLQLKEKENEIININEIYAGKFGEIFSENLSLIEQMENEKSEKESIEIKYNNLNNENKMLKDIIVKNEIVLKDKESRINNLQKSVEDGKMSSDEKIIKLEDELKIAKENIIKNSEYHVEIEAKNKINENNFNIILKLKDEEIGNNKNEKIELEYILLEKLKLNENNFNNKLKEKDEDLDKIKINKLKLEEKLINNENEIKKIEISYNISLKRKDAVIENITIENKKLQEKHIGSQNEIKNKEVEINSKSFDKEIEFEKFKKDKLKLEEIVFDKENEIKLKESNFENKLKQKDEDIKKLKLENSENENKFKELSFSNLKIEEKDSEIKLLQEKLARLEKKLNLSISENENIKEIITKDQIRIKDLKEFKEKTLKQNDSNNLLSEENNILKSEINLIKTKYDEETLKLNDINKINQSIQNEKDNLKKEVVQREKLIENIKIGTEDLKIKLIEHEKKVNKLEIQNSILLNDNKTLNEVTPVKIENNINNKDIYLSNKNSKLETELIVDYIFNLYLYDNSINLQHIIQILLNNFNLYMNTIFLRKEDYNLSFSLVHEFLEDLFMRVYDAYIKTKFTQIKEKGSKVIRNAIIISNSVDSNNKITKSNTIINKQNKPTTDSNTNNEIWMINKNDVDNDMIKLICNDILNSNLVSKISSMNKKEKSVDDILEIFRIKYEKIYKTENSSEEFPSMQDYIKNEIRPKVIEKIEKYKYSLVDELQTLVEFSVANFNSGKLNLNNRELYDFKNFYAEYLSRDLRQKDSLYVSQILTTSEAIDNLVFTIKNNSKFLKSIFLVGCFNNSNNTNLISNFALERVTLSLILECPNIVSLSITDSNLDENHLPHLIKLIEFLKGLKFLDLSGNNIKESGLKIIAERLKFNKTLMTLNLSKNKIESYGGFYLADSLIKNNTIEKLFLSGNKINETGLSSLLTVLANNNNSVKYLDLSDNMLSANDLKCISELITDSQSLVSLNISNNFLDPVSANYISLSLKQSQNLCVLHLENTELNYDSAPLLLNNLSGANLSEIYFDNNPFGEVGAILIANILKHNNYLKFVSLKKCGLTPMSLICLCKVLEINTGLEGINLEQNWIDEITIDLLGKCLKSRSNGLKIYLTALNLSLKSKESIKNNASFVLI